MHQAGFHSSPGEHVTEATRMMIAPAVFLRGLRVNCSTKLASPYDQRLVEQASLPQVGDQAGRRVIGVAALPWHVAREVGVMIPAHVKQLDKPHIALSQPPGQQAVRREGTRLFHVRPVKLEDMIRFSGDIGQLRHTRLHPERHLVLGDARLDFRVAQRVVSLPVQRPKVVKHVPPHVAVDAVRVGKVIDRIAAVAKLHPRMLGGQKTGRPQSAVQRLGIAGAAPGGHDDVRRQVTVHRTETVGHPRTDARPAGELKAGLQKRDRRVVVDRLGMN